MSCSSQTVRAIPRVLVQRVGAALCFLSSNERSSVSELKLATPPQIRARIRFCANSRVVRMPTEFDACGGMRLLAIHAGYQNQHEAPRLSSSNAIIFRITPVTLARGDCATSSRFDGLTRDTP